MPGQDHLVADSFEQNAVVRGLRRKETRHQLARRLGVADQQTRPVLGCRFGHKCKSRAGHRIKVLA